MLQLVEFATEFVNTARDYARDYRNIRMEIFTTRQSIAIASLGITRILRKQEALSVQDLISLSVITTEPEAQKFAEMIALKVIYGDTEIRDSYQPVELDELDEDDAADKIKPKQLTAQSLLLNDILDYLDLDTSVDTRLDLVYHQFADEVEEELFDEKPSKDKKLSQEEFLEIARKRVSFEIIGGRTGIIQYKIKDWLSLITKAKQMIILSIPQIENQYICYTQILAMSDEISKLSTEAYIQVIADLMIASGMRDEKELELEITEGLDYFSYNQLSRTLSIMEEYNWHLDRFNIKLDFYAPLLLKIIAELESRIRELAKTLDDLMYNPDIYDEDYLNRDKLVELLENSLENDSLLDILKKTKEFDDLFNTNTSELLENYLDELEDEIGYDDIISNPISSPQWFDIFNSKVKEEFENTHDFNSWNSKMDVMSELSEKINQGITGETIKSHLKEIIKNMINTSQSFNDLQDTVNSIKQHKQKLPIRQIKKRAKELNLPSNEIAQLVGDFVESIKYLMENNLATYEKVEDLLKEHKLTDQQFNELLKKAKKHNSEGVVASLAARNLEAVADNLSKSKKGQELLIAALAAGGGENLLDQWFMCGHRLPDSVRQIVKDAAKRVMIDLAKSRAAALIGSSEAGPLPEGTIRPFHLGDDPDTIDIDESLDNILSMGKRLKDVEAGDFIVRKTVSGRRCVVFLIDISGSMTGQPLASASLAAAMLLFAFSRDELGLALFESDTHVLCEIDKQIEIDEIIDEVLDLTARGGTQMQRALEWAENQFIQSSSKDKMFIMLTDAMIGDFHRCTTHFKAIAEMEATSVLVMPHTSYGIGQIQSIIDEANAQLITVNDWRSFPEIVSNILSRS